MAKFPISLKRKELPLSAHVQRNIGMSVFRIAVGVQRDIAMNGFREFERADLSCGLRADMCRRSIK